MIREILSSQYSKALGMLSDVVQRYDEKLWNDIIHYRTPTWQIVYHAVFYANIYCSPSENRIMHWEYERPDYNDHKKMHEKRKNGIAIEPYSKQDMLEYINHVLSLIPGYLVLFEPEKKCWPFWYDENQFEFHINNLRHIQHHTGEITERHDIYETFEYPWM